jgi:hypothetical protein
MTSVLNVDTIADKAGTGPVALTKQSAAKAWGHFEGSDATLDDSFNTTSLTDNGTGSFSPQLTNSFGNANYASSTNCANTSNTASNSGSKAQTYATGSFNIVTTQNGAEADVNDTIYTAHGDLA